MLVTALDSQPAYFIAEVALTDKDGYVNNFAPIITKVFNKFGGFHLSRGGEVLQVEGQEASSRGAIIEFPSLAKAKEMIASIDYKDAMEIGRKYCTYRVYITEGLEVGKRH